MSLHVVSKQDVKIYQPERQFLASDKRIQTVFELLNTFQLNDRFDWDAKVAVTTFDGLQKG